MQDRSPPAPRLACLALACLAAAVAAAAPPARAEGAPAAGEVARDRLDLAGRQVVLPAGDWVVAGHGYDQVAGLEDVPYGAIENVVLFRLAGERVVAFVLAQRNAIPVENGWGVAPECRRGDLLGRVVYDAAEGHSMCGFVIHALTSVEPDSASAWKAAVAFARARGLALPGAWLVAGFRRSDLTDTLDVRYHFDPAVLAGVPGAGEGGSGWSRAEIYGGGAAGGVWGAVGDFLGQAAFWRVAPDREPAASPAVQARADVVNDLRDWLARMRYAVELGFENRAGILAEAPMPWTPAQQGFRPELARRLAVLDELGARGVLPPEEQARQRAVAEELSAPAAARRWTAEELTVVKTIVDQVSGAVSYFGADLLYSGTVQTASQIWAVDQLLDGVRYTALEYGWQKLGPRRLTADEVVVLPGAGVESRRGGGR